MYTIKSKVSAVESGSASFVPVDFRSRFPHLKDEEVFLALEGQDELLRQASTTKIEMVAKLESSEYLSHSLSKKLAFANEDLCNLKSLLDLHNINFSAIYFSSEGKVIGAPVCDSENQSPSSFNGDDDGYFYLAICVFCSNSGSIQIVLFHCSYASIVLYPFGGSRIIEVGRLARH